MPHNTYQITRPRNWHDSGFRLFMFSYISLYVKHVTSEQGNNLSKGGRRQAQHTKYQGYSRPCRFREKDLSFPYKQEFC